MEPLLGFWDYFWMLAAAAISGAIGGLGFELMQTRVQNHTGAIETPHLLPDSSSNISYFDLGVWSNILLGAITAVSVLYIFPPEARTTIQYANSIPQTTLYYDVVKLIAFSLIVGSAGPSFLSSIQGRATAALKDQKATALSNAANEQVNKIGEETRLDVENTHARLSHRAREKLNKLHTKHKEHSQAVGSIAGNGNGKGGVEIGHEYAQAKDVMDSYMENTIDDLLEMCDEAEKDLLKRLDTRIDSAKNTLAGIAAHHNKRIASN